MELSIALFDAGLRLMVVNPQASHNFAKVLGKHSKTDQVDADTLAQFAERMPFKPWQRPSDAQLALRAFARRIRTLTDDRTAAKNQLHATDFNQHAPKAVLKDVKQGITQLDKRIAALTHDAVAFIETHKDLKAPYDLLITVKGIAASSAKTHDPHIKAYAQHLAVRGKTPMQVVCAVMRKLLHAIHGMLNTNAPFDGKRFYVIPEKSAPLPT